MIRIAKLDDLDGVLDLYKELRPNDPCLDTDFVADKWRELLDDLHSDIIVADLDGTLASTCALGLNPSIANGARPFGIIEHVITSESHRRQGLSKAVLEFAIDLAWKKGCYKVMLLSGENLQAAHDLYESVGFKAGIEKGFVIKP
jgi:GNAT superfamily N-acetyltransferase